MANFNLNKVILGGRLTADPELKTAPSGVSVTSFTMAVNRSYDRNTVDFHNVTAWRKTAEFITQYFRKGSSICIVGSLQNREWTDKNGSKRISAEVVADEANFVDAKGDTQRSEYDDSAYSAAPVSSEPVQFEPLGDDEELPF